MNTKYSIKQILLSNQNWWRFYRKHQHRIRDDILVAIVKLLSCKNSIRGRQVYGCTNTKCTHVKYVPFTCKAKPCSSCGKKATEQWLQKQMGILPNTTWQHITFTMPSELWDFFWLNRPLLNQIAKLAADCIKKIAQQKKVIPGIFIAIHTFGRNLKRNVHIHLSTTTGGLSHDGQQWKPLFFHQNTLMKMWRYRIVQLFRQTRQQHQLTLPDTLQKQFNLTHTFENWLNKLYQKNWVVHCSKPDNNFQHNLNYLSRYIKRPPIAESKLKHYDGNEVTFQCLDHYTKSHRRFTLSVEQFIARFIQHIPDVGFRMIRYYGFLSHRLRGKLLPIVQQLVGKITLPWQSTHYAPLMQKEFNVDPLKCILCGHPLQLTAIRFGKTSIAQLMPHHKQLALLQKI